MTDVQSVEQMIQKHDMLTEHISNIKIELEIMKVKSWRNKDDAILKRVSEIDKSVSSIIDEIIDLNTTSQRHSS